MDTYKSNTGLLLSGFIIDFVFYVLILTYIRNYKLNCSTTS